MVYHLAVPAKNKICGMRAREWVLSGVEGVGTDPYPFVVEGAESGPFPSVVKVAESGPFPFVVERVESAPFPVAVEEVGTGLFLFAVKEAESSYYVHPVNPVLAVGVQTTAQDHSICWMLVDHGLEA
jgi:hypothetical protein